MGELRVMGRAGDTKHIWDKDNQDEVAAARELFEELTGKGFVAFKVGVGGKKTNKMKSFDPQAGKVILVPKIAGG